MSPYEQWIAFLTIMRKEVRRYLRIWTQTSVAISHHDVAVLFDFWHFDWQAYWHHGRR